MIIPESNLKFSANDDFTELTITGFESNKKFEGKVVEIPAKIQGVLVTAIGESAFASTGYDISGIWIPDSVKKIGAGAFTWSRFDSIRLPSGLEVIEQDTFKGCEAKTINIPSSVKVIMAGAFSGSDVESVVIPKNCAIGKRNEDDNSYFHSGSAFSGSKIKTLTISGGRVYFYENSLGDEDYKKFRNFSSCDNLEKIVIPKDFDPLYVADNTSKEYTLADFFAGEKISSSLALQKQLKSVKVRNSHKVESAEQSIEYDKAFKAGDWDKAIQIAEKFNDSEWNAKFDNAYVKKYESLFSKGDYAAAIQCTKDRYSKHSSRRDDFDSASWRERFLAANEKPVLDSYNKELSAKNFEKAKKTAKEFLEKIDKGPEAGFNGLDLYWLKEKWQGLLRDVDYAIYLPAFMDSLLKQEGTIFKDGKDVVFMLPLPDGAFKYAGRYGEDKFVLKDSGDEEITIGRKDFLARFNEKTGKSFSVTSEKGKNYLCREATAEEKSAYEKKLEAEQAALLQAKLEAEKKQAEEAAALLKKKKDIFKSYMDSALKNAKIEKNGDDYRIKFSLSGELYDMADRVFSFKDSEGKSIKITEDEFHQFVKEIYNTHYEIARGGSYLYRKATTEEKNSAVQKEKDFFKAYMDSALKNSKIEKKWKWL
ncbi:leucine-rich repeat protein [Treponema zioleckii]|uniref:leucine-rich repeat protein n=1 Tax=Treponema zioleckii TaxID=331680 RepID=UPI00168BD4A7|nr:leucine-rich repeat protein [Treponema zioleckii]